MTRLNFSIFSVVAFVFAELNFTNWQPPKEGDLRAPCPAMNSLANHNFINHDGTNITVESLVPILGEVFHWSTEVATIVSEQGLAAAPDPSKGVFTLGDLNNHNIFEHDASLSRADYYFGEHDDHTFRQDIFDQFLSFFDGQENVTLKTAGAARYKRVQQSRADNPTFTYGETQQFFSYAETIFYFRAIVDPVTKACPVAWVKILFEQQRLPYLEGWRPPKTQFNGVNLARDVLELALVTPEKNQTITDNPRGGSIIA